MLHPLSYLVIVIICAGFLLYRYTEIYVTQILIIQNLLIFMFVFIPGLQEPVMTWTVYSQLAGRAIYLQSLDLFFGKFYTFITLMYLHAGFMHIAGNLLILFFIGVALEERIGKRLTALIYFPAGLMATVGQYLVNWGTVGLNLGASGAVMGLMGAIVYMFPKEKITMFLGPVLMRNVRVDLAVAVFIMMQTAIAFFGGSSNIAHAAHFTGFGFGMLLGYVVKTHVLDVEEEKDTSYYRLKRLAKDQELRDIYVKIDEAEDPDIRNAWIEEFLDKAECPRCGGSIEDGRCECGYDVWED